MGNDKKYAFIYFLVTFTGEFRDVFVCMVTRTHQHSVISLFLGLTGLQITCFDIPTPIVFEIFILFDTDYLKIRKIQFQ